MRMRVLCVLTPSCIIMDTGYAVHPRVWGFSPRGSECLRTLAITVRCGEGGGVSRSFACIHHYAALLFIKHSFGFDLILLVSQFAFSFLSRFLTRFFFFF